MKKKFVWIIVLIACVLVGVVKARVEFQKIESAVIDGQVVSYTKRSRIESMVQENQDALEQITGALMQLDYFDELVQITIPFDSKREISVYAGNESERDLGVDLTERLQWLAQELKINHIYLKNLADGRMLFFVQTDGSNDTWQGAGYAVDHVMDVSTKNTWEHLRTLRSIANGTGGSYLFIRAFDAVSSSNWYYGCSRDATSKDEGVSLFWQTVYDLIYGNLK